jgi:hypothetical protein
LNCEATPPDAKAVTTQRTDRTKNGAPVAIETSVRAARGGGYEVTLKIKETPAAAEKNGAGIPLEVQHSVRAQKGEFVVLSVGPHFGQPQAFVLQLRDALGRKPVPAK